MKHAIRTVTGVIIREGITIEDARTHIRVNPNNVLVKQVTRQGKKCWKAIDNNELFGINKA